jgi:uncharacterized protein (DUF58 family)
MPTDVLTTDFCPWANKYVYWLKEPIGWFVVALGISVLVGMHVTPIGWVLASAIGGIVLVGMAWPWIATRAVQCRLSPAVAEVYERQTCDLIFSVRNRFPLPLWGLAIEGYLDREGDEIQPTVALACVPPISEADYRLAVRPELRGHYPLAPPKVACSFPFGLWTARKVVTDCSPLIVFPEVSMIQDDPSFVGARISESGEGQRAGQIGEMLGVREFRSGDRLRNVHWVHTARTGNLVVCERGAPQQQAIEVVLDVNATAATGPASREVNRNAVAWRVRVAASLVTHLHARHIPVTLRCGQRVIHGSSGQNGLRRMLLELADVPADGVAADANGTSVAVKPRGVVLAVSNDEIGSKVLVDLWCQQPGFGAMGISSPSTQASIELHRCVSAQLLRFWREVENAHAAA